MFAPGGGGANWGMVDVAVVMRAAPRLVPPAPPVLLAAAVEAVDAFVERDGPLVLPFMVASVAAALCVARFFLAFVVAFMVDVPSVPARVVEVFGAFARAVVFEGVSLLVVFMFSCASVVMG